MAGLVHLLVTAGCLMVTGSALAQVPGAPARLPCHEYKAIARQLSERYGETPVSIGIQGNGNVLQVFASSNTGTFTVLSVAPSGIGCIVAAGRNWQQATPTAMPPAT